jgi:hypothetical protein
MLPARLMFPVGEGSLAFRRSESLSCRRTPASRFVVGSQSKSLDSGLHRNNENRSRLPVDKFRNPRLGAEGCSVFSRA